MLQLLGTHSNVHLADIHRAFCNNSGMDIAYKPLHNQLKKKANTGTKAPDDDLANSAVKRL
jgi:hypothetical protein